MGTEVLEYNMEKKIKELQVEIDNLRFELSCSYHFGYKDVDQLWRRSYENNYNKETQELNYNGFTDDVSEAINGLVNQKLAKKELEITSLCEELAQCHRFICDSSDREELYDQWVEKEANDV